MILNNPMDKQEARDKVSMRLKGRVTNPGNLFQVGNPGGGFTGKKHSKSAKAKQSIKNIEREQHKHLKKFKKGYVPWNKGLCKKNTTKEVKDENNNIN